jgi:UDP-glucuronate decarboxylase
MQERRCPAKRTISGSGLGVQPTRPAPSDARSATQYRWLMPSMSADGDSSRAPWGLPYSDLLDGVVRARSDLSALSGARVLITGGTGFLGSWLVASLLIANDRLELGTHLSVLTRNPGALEDLAGPGLTLLPGDVRHLRHDGVFDYIVHGAASSSATRGDVEVEAMRMTETIVDGTRSILAIAARNSARVLFLSSGAVYGPQTGVVTEDCRLSPDPTDPGTSYGQAKRLAENLCAVATQSGQAEAVLARLFAFVGPRIPTDAHFAAGNFLGDAVAGRPITVRGDGLARRSYLYTGDLPEWCWSLLVRGRSGVAYNVGSPEPITIKDLASRAAALSPGGLDVEVLGQPSDRLAPWYVPSTRLAQREFGLEPRTSLDVALKKTYDWLASNQKGLSSPPRPEAQAGAPLPP